MYQTQMFPQQMMMPGMMAFTPWESPNPNSSGLPANRGGSLGDVVDEYILGQEICEGSYGIVRHATKTDDPSQRFAIKVVKKERFCDDEVNLQCSLEHSNVVKIMKSFSHNDMQYIVLEYCGGGDLFEFVNRKRVLDEATVAKYFTQMLAAVEALHQRQVAHHDIKLENFLLTDDFQTVKLCDFGAAEHLPDTPITTRFKGELSAPEKTQGAHYNAFVADIYQLGKSLHELAFGLRQPKNNGNINPPASVTPSPAMYELLVSMLQTDPSKRPKLEEVKAHHWIGSCCRVAVPTSPVQAPVQLPCLQTQFSQPLQQAPTITQFGRAQGQPMYSIPDRSYTMPSYQQFPQVSQVSSPLSPMSPGSPMTDSNNQNNFAMQQFFNNYFQQMNNMQQMNVQPQVSQQMQQQIPQLPQQMTYTNRPQTTQQQVIPQDGRQFRPQGTTSCAVPAPQGLPSTVPMGNTVGHVPVPQTTQPTSLPNLTIPTFQLPQQVTQQVPQVQQVPRAQHVQTQQLSSPLSNQAGVVWTPVAQSSPPGSPSLSPQLSPSFSTSWVPSMQPMVK